MITDGHSAISIAGTLLELDDPSCSFLDADGTENSQHWVAEVVGWDQPILPLEAKAYVRLRSMWDFLDLVQTGFYIPISQFSQTDPFGPPIICRISQHGRLKYVRPMHEDYRTFLFKDPNYQEQT